MSNHACLDTFCGSPCESIEYPGDSRNNGKSPVREFVIETQMSASKDQRCADEGCDGIAGPFSQPLLQQSPEEKFFRQRHHPKYPQKSPGSLKSVVGMRSKLHQTKSPVPHADERKGYCKEARPDGPLAETGDEALLEVQRLAPRVFADHQNCEGRSSNQHDLSESGEFDLRNR